MPRPPFRLLIVIAVLATPPAAIAKSAADWYYTGFTGAVSTEYVSDILRGTVNPTDTTVFGGSVGRTILKLTPDLALGAEAILARHDGEQDHWEFDAIAWLRWLSFPWQRHVRTSVALGMGPSLASRVPATERDRHGEDGSGRLTNFVFGEIALGAPAVPDYDVVLRVHHRSGIFGLIDGIDDASTAFVIGIKGRF